MREYKFRAKAIEEMADGNQTVYGFGVHVVELADGSKEYVLYNENGTYHVDPETVGQYTGLQDKNGKEIYEGDIIKQESMLFTPVSKRPQITSMIGEVEYRGTGYRVRGKTEHSKMTDSPLYPSCEAIGTRWDNPELLGG